MSRRFGTLILSMLFVTSFAVLGTGVASAQEEDSSGLSCSPEDPPPAATLSCQADGLQADTPAQWSAEFAGGSTDGGEATADANGSAQFQFDVPDEEGEYTVSLDGTAGDGGTYSESFSGEVRAQGPDEDDDEECPDGEGTSEGDDDGDGEEDDCPDDEDDGNGQDDGRGEGDDQDDDNGQGEGEQGQGQEKISLCHATASATNPYVFITVGAPAATKGGHANHEGDIIPAEGPEDCPFGEAALSCVSTAGVGSEDANPIFCRVLDLTADQPAQWEATCPDGSREGQLTADGQGVGRFDFGCSTGDFDVMVLGSSADGGEFQASGTGVAGVFFADDEAAPAPQVEEVPVGPVAAGFGGTAEPDRTGAIVALGVLAALAASSTARLSRRVGRFEQR